MSERTFRRWEADNRAPLAVLKLLRLLSGKLDALDPAFNRFWIRQGRLFNDQFPNGDIVRLEDGSLSAHLAGKTDPRLRL